MPNAPSPICSSSRYPRSGSPFSSRSGSWRRMRSCSRRSSRRGVDPELLGQDRPGSLEGGERLRLAVGAVEREHQLAPQAFAQRVRPREALELGDHVRVMAEVELGVELLLQGLEAELLEAGDLACERGLIGEVRQGGAAPERERLGQDPVGRPRLGAVRPCASASRSSNRRSVDVLALGPEQVAGARASMPSDPRTERSRETYICTVDLGSSGRSSPHRRRSDARRTRPCSRPARDGRARSAASGPQCETGPSCPETSSLTDTRSQRPDGPALSAGRRADPHRRPAMGHAGRDADGRRGPGWPRDLVRTRVRLQPALLPESRQHPDRPVLPFERGVHEPERQALWRFPGLRRSLDRGDLAGRSRVPDRHARKVLQRIRGAARASGLGPVVRDLRQRRVLRLPGHGRRGGEGIRFGS